MKLSKAAIQELDEICEENDGLLRARDVLDAARARDSALHTYFDWDDSSAAEQYRLAQARQVIRVSVRIIERDDRKFIHRAYVSLTTDRASSDPVYRPFVSVMTDEFRYQQLLEDAMDQIRQWRKRYEDLIELKDVFDSIEKTQKNIANKSRRKSSKNDEARPPA